MNTRDMTQLREAGIVTLCAALLFVYLAWCANVVITAHEESRASVEVSHVR